jgi:hypothetical protein
MLSDGLDIKLGCYWYTESDHGKIRLLDQDEGFSGGVTSQQLMFSSSKDQIPYIQAPSFYQFWN